MYIIYNEQKKNKQDKKKKVKKKLNGNISRIDR